jgi:hypothetical protein
MENENLLPIQKLCRYLEQQEPALFDVYTDVGRDFLRFAAKCMSEEKEALRTAYIEGCLNSKRDMKTAEEYMNEKYQI